MDLFSKPLEQALGFCEQPNSQNDWDNRPTVSSQNDWDNRPTVSSQDDWDNRPTVENSQASLTPYTLHLTPYTLHLTFDAHRVAIQHRNRYNAPCAMDHLYPYFRPKLQTSQQVLR
ncbi:MAG: hypothetical protein KGS49_06180 [Planctomycetes bacterium]|nr:hypothetical protein [Planctomycetota bacterium]